MESPDEVTMAEADGDVKAHPVTAHRSSPDRLVLTEADNHDGWISSDLAVELER